MIDGIEQGRSAFLASVTDGQEARLALAGGAQIIDCKDPSRGALGRLEAGRIREVVAVACGRVPVSATVGDIACDADLLVPAARDIAATGVDLVKVGFFGGSDASLAIAALGRAELANARLIAVLMADRDPDFATIELMAEAKFAGVMLDTADKGSGSLLDVLGGEGLATFIEAARRAGLACGLAGSLRIEHVARLVSLKPDVIGFRGALCISGRTSGLDARRIGAVRGALDSSAGFATLDERSVA